MWKGCGVLDDKNCAAGHVLCLKERTRLTATGVMDVGTVTEDGISAATKAGTLHVRGKGLKVIRLDAATGELELAGEVQAVSYVDEQRHRSWLARLFR